MKAIRENAARWSRAAWVAVSVLIWAGALLPAQGQPTAPGAAEDPAKAKESVVAEPGEFSNSLTLGVGHFFVDGDDAQFMRQLQKPAETFGGIEELHFEQAFGAKGLFQIDAHSIFDNDDYGISLDVREADVGYVRGGYSQFRTWYDGSGGYSARSNAWISIYDEELYVDRERAWIEAGLTLPEWPVFGVRYSYEVRDGSKDSTIWGDYNLTQNPASQVLRGIIPTFREIDEKRHIVDADIRHTIGKTTFGVGVRYERDEVDNTLNILRRFGETNRVRAVTQEDGVGTDIISSRAFVESRLHPKVLFTVGGAYTWLDTDLAGNRIYGPTYGSPLNPTYVNRQNNDEGFYDLNGGSQADQYVANLNFFLTPWRHVAIIPSLRFEHQDQSGVSLFTETRVTNAATAFRTEDLVNRRTREFTDVTEALELRYSGFTNWAFYTRAEALQGQGRLKEDEFDAADDGVGPAQLSRDTDSERYVQKYTVGANWYPLRKLNFGSQYFYRTRNNEYDHVVDTARFNPPTTNNLYPAFIREHDYDTHDVNFRMTFRPLGSLTLVSRYDFMITTYRTRGGVDAFGNALGETESAESTGHVFSQSASWSPLALLYFQGSISYALQETESQASSVTGASGHLVQDSESDYWNTSLMAGCILTSRTDLQAQYNYYRADNYVDNSQVSLPYGAGAIQQGVTVSLLTRIAKNHLWKIQYGFYTGNEETSNGNNDYDAHLVYSSWQYLF